MKCHKIQKWIYLYKEGELSDKQVKAVEEHVQTCSGCAQLAKNISVLQAGTKDVKTEPILHNPEALTVDIMNHIKYNHSKKTVQPHRFHRALRYTLQFAMLLIVLLFAVQEIDTRRRMMSLEQRMQTTRHSHMLTIKNPLVNPDDISINKKVLLELLNENRLLRMEFEKLRNELREQGVDVDSTLLQNDKVKELISDPQVLEKIFEL